MADEEKQSIWARGIDLLTQTGNAITGAGAVDDNEVAVLKAERKASTQTAEELAARAKKYGTPTTHRYPSNVDSSEQPHSVRFRIKVREQSAIGQALTSRSGGNLNYEDSNGSRVSAENYGSILGAGVGAVAAGSALGALAGGKGAIQKIALGGIAAGIGYAGAKALGGTPNRTIKTQTFIQLYIPQSVSTAYSAQWQDAELGAIVGVLSKGTDGSIASILQGGGEFAARSVAGGAGALAKGLGVDLDARGAIQAASRKVENPNKEQLFKTMNFRDFAFEYKFAPKNRSELQSVMHIIHEFKIHMHSEKDASGLFLVYPSEFDIQYQYKGKQNNFVNKIASCALTDVKITYGASGQFTTFKDVGGAPSEITMQLAFKELEILTREKIEGGY